MQIGKAIANGVMTGSMASGVMLGATAGGILDSDNRIKGAAMGGLIGAAVPSILLGPFAGLEPTLNAGKNIGKAGLKVGEGVTKGLGKATIGISKGIGNSMMKTFSHNPVVALGAVAAGAAIGGILGDMDQNSDPKQTMRTGALIGLGASIIPGGAAALTGLGVAGVGAGVIGANAVGAVGKSMIEKTAEGGYKLSATASPILIGAMAVQGISQGIKTFEKSRMGTNDGQMVGPAPSLPTIQNNRTPSYANNAGATGDLVFSMFNNR